MQKDGFSIPSISTLFQYLPSDQIIKIPSVNTEFKKEPPKKLKFGYEEDLLLYKIVISRSCKNWNEVAAQMGTRNARQCRERWNNYLNPFLRNDPWSPQEDELLISKYKQFGPKWRKIAQFFVNRSDNSLRNRYFVLERKLNRNPSESSTVSDE
ncbi:Myb-like DNA-binding domain containing protein [Trichomonas vaginalis G3]|uniref:Myb-like DNA-binding domain containing protein n=1 Tax=Trichomonas vaginalis (strain ATCC PRA-98 / G3) TaxID=412133 RepID=A2E344_TRIV3|nr:RNA polymerase II transcription regulator recruiting protein [Trichomonas vaginalis G3]EAY12980.1 Myb-like DNA-binding domain containing protein [Trichomonas vaginalis G3]KAI5499803.1 RNA polymerase II transcription regulator recruiting protein [Trichomonas vaginalis G3]|eukprot:XP_001325203.1 Myb-like DNA-binding domain containing protein [Trichomonas vaginalis G3]